MEQTELLKNGSLSRIDEMLFAQAHTLDSIFTVIAIHASSAMKNDLGKADTLLRLALKSQSQCRANLEAIAEMKNPGVVAFVRQANISNGPQQVNTESSMRTRRKTKSRKTN